MGKIIRICKRGGCKETPKDNHDYCSRKCFHKSKRRKLNWDECRRWRIQPNGKRKLEIRKRKGKGRGNYRRTEKTRFNYRVKQLGKPGWCTVKEGEMMEEEKNKVAKRLKRDAIAGRIPNLSSLIKKGQEELLKSEAYQKEKDEVKRLNMLNTIIIGAIDYSISKWEALPITGQTFPKFMYGFMKHLKGWVEESRKTIKDINDIKYGKTINIKEKGAFEDELDGAVDITPKKVEDGNTDTGKTDTKSL